MLVKGHHRKMVPQTIEKCGSYFFKLDNTQVSTRFLVRMSLELSWEVPYPRHSSPEMTDFIFFHHGGRWIFLQEGFFDKLSGCTRSPLPKAQGKIEVQEFWKELRFFRYSSGISFTIIGKMSFEQHLSFYLKNEIEKMKNRACNLSITML